MYNVCGGAPLKMRVYTDLLIKFSKLQDIKMVINEKLWRPIDIQFQDGDASLIKKELGWEPKISFEELVKEMVEKDLKSIS